MPLNLAPQDQFEDKYTAKFRVIAADHGVIINYDRDRAAIDIGVHLSSQQRVGDMRIWFQLKGIHAETLDAETFQKASEVNIDLEVEHLRQWYRSPEPVYLVIYVESADCFLAADTRRLIDKTYGDTLFRITQKQARFRLATSERLDQALWARMLNHQSMRTDIGTFRGNPLAHPYDVRWRTPMRMEPALFSDVVRAILAEHKYRESETMDMTQVFLGTGDEAKLSLGRLFDPYEWHLHFGADFISDENGYCEDAKPFRIQGTCGVVIHSNVVSRPDLSALNSMLFARLKHKEIKNLLVFVNHYAYQSFVEDEPYNCFPEFSQAARRNGLFCVPQHLEELGRTILSTTNVYLKFRDKIEWVGLSHAIKKHGKLYVLNNDGTRTELTEDHF